MKHYFKNLKKKKRSFISWFFVNKYARVNSLSYMATKYALKFQFASNFIYFWFGNCSDF